ncbi:MAG TPA: hypothetical protein VGG65_07280, partial [Thermoanaerobaculia bacterium]
MRPLKALAASAATMLFAAVTIQAAIKPGEVIQVGPAPFHPTTPARVAPKASDLALAAPRLPDAARHSLGALTASERAELTSPDRRGGFPRRKKPAVKIGISRAL